MHKAEPAAICVLVPLLLKTERKTPKNEIQTNTWVDGGDAEFLINGTTWTDINQVIITRGYSGQDFPTWIQGI